MPLDFLTLSLFAKKTLILLIINTYLEKIIALEPIIFNLVPDAHWTKVKRT